MADGTIQLEISAPERDPFDMEAEEVIVPGGEGIFTVMPGHTPLLTTVTPGVVHARDPEGRPVLVAVSEGFAEVFRDRVSVMTDAFETAETIDPERAKAARERAEQRLREPGEETDQLRAEMAMQRALARLQAHSGVGH